MKVIAAEGDRLVKIKKKMVVRWLCTCRKVSGQVPNLGVKNK